MSGFKRIYYDASSNKIYHWFYDDEGKSHQEEVHPAIEYYVPDQTKQSPIKDIFGNPVTLQTSENVYAMKNISAMTNVCEADLSQDIKYLQKYYKGKELKLDINAFNIAFLDVEIMSPSEFPKAEFAKYPINLISVYFSKLKQVYTFGTTEYTGTSELVKNYHYCETEQQMIESFIDFFRKQKVDILGGWSSRSFDVPYIINRCKNLNIEKSLSPIGIYKEKHYSGYHIDEGEGYIIAGLNILDELDMYKNYEKEKQTSYSLQNIGMLVVNEGKKDLEGTINNAWKENWNAFVEYNVQDVLLVKKIEDVKKYIELTINLCYQALIPFDKIFSTITLVEGYVLKYLHQNNMVMPSRPKNDNIEKLPGAYVYAKTGAYKNCLTYDIESLYPHMILMWGISTETLKLNNDKFGKTPLSEYKTWETKDGDKEFGGIYYDRSKPGILPQIIERILSERKIYKKKMFIADAIKNNRSLTKYDQELVKQVQQEQMSSEYYDGQQYTRKIMANCFHKDTKILTIDGIKFIKDVKVGDLVYSINKNNNNLEIKPVLQTYEYDYNGEMLSFKNIKVDLQVTSDHTMLKIPNLSSSVKQGTIIDIKAKDLIKECHWISPIHNKSYIDLTNKYIYLNEHINNINDYELLLEYPESDLRLTRKNLELKNIKLTLEQCFTRKHTAFIKNNLSNDTIRTIFDNGYIILARNKRSRQCNPTILQIDLNNFSKFIGLYLSEGSLYINKMKQFKTAKRGISKKITIAQYRNIHRKLYKEIESIIKEMVNNRITIYKERRSISFSSDLLYDVIFQNFSSKYDKHIFNNTFENKLNLNEIFKYTYKGDGTNPKKNGDIHFQYNMSTKYKQYFEDYIKLCLFLGFIPRYSLDNFKYNNKPYSMFRIHRNIGPLWVNKNKFNKIFYNDKVYNLTVADNHTVCVGLNGKFAWTGQSVFGCAANEYFHLYNYYNAITITLGGQHLIKYLTSSFEKYMKENFHLIVKKYYPNFTGDFKPLTRQMVVQIDTDSSMLCLDEVITNLGLTITTNQQLYDFMIDIDKRIITPFFNKILKIYADSYGVKQIINFKREKIITQKITIAMKKYIDEIIANEDKLYIDKPKLSITGVEIIRTDTPKFCKSELKNVLKKIFETKMLNKTTIIEQIKTIKNSFINSNITDIAIPKGVSEYTKYAKDIDDYIKNGLSYPSACPIHVRAAINYNYIIKKYNLPLQPIFNGTKLKYIHVLDRKNELHQNIIGFVGTWPEEFNKLFTIDYETQWERVFTTIIQRVFDALNWSKITLETNSLDSMIEF